LVYPASTTAILLLLSSTLAATPQRQKLSCKHLLAKQHLRLLHCLQQYLHPHQPCGLLQQQQLLLPMMLQPIEQVR
jgi:hypothetical protein